MRTDTYNSLTNAAFTYTKCLNDNGTISSCEGTRMPADRQTPQSSVKFLQCKFSRLLASGKNGGAICYTVSGGSLEIVECVFDTCETTINEVSGTGGGAVFVSETSEFVVSSSLFLSCVCHTSYSSDGGAIEMVDPTSTITINNCAFVRCCAYDDGGAVCIWGCPSCYNRCFSEYRFIGCEGKDPASSDGGSLIVWNSNAVVSCSNTLFADSHSTFHGGAAAYYIRNGISHDSSLYLFSFCFFKDNSAKDIYGADIFFEEWVPTVPFLHSYSTTVSSRICYVEDSANWNVPEEFKNKDNWLP